MKKIALLALSCLVSVALWAQSADMSAYAPKLAVGTEAPEIVLQRVDTACVVKLSDYRGQYVLVDFWASWCGDCRREMPIMKKALEPYAEKVAVLSVSFDNSQQSLQAYLAKNPMEWTVVSDYSKWKESAVTKAYELSWIPTFYIVDPEGRVAGKGITGEELKTELERLFAAD